MAHYITQVEQILLKHNNATLQSSCLSPLKSGAHSILVVIVTFCEAVLISTDPKIYVVMSVVI